MILSLEELTLRFTYHKPSRQQNKQHDDIRKSVKQLATIFNTLPEGREAALAFTKLEEAEYWAQEAISRRGELE